MSIAKGTFYMFIAGMISLASGYAITIYLARKLGPGDFGVYTIITSLLFVLSVVLMYGIQQTTAKFVSERPNEKEGILYKVLLMQTVVAVGLFALYFVISPLLSSVFQEPRAESYIRFGALFIVFQSLFAVYIGYLNGLERYKEQSLMVSIYALLKGAIVIFLVYIGYSILGAIIGLVVSALICMVISIIAFGFKKAGTRVTTKQIIKFGVPVLWLNVIILLLMNMDLFMVKGMISGNIGAGIYTAALTISRAPYYVIHALSVTIFPVVAGLHHKKKESSLSQKIRKAILYTTIVLVLVCALVSTSAMTLTKLIFGADYISSGPVLNVLIFGGTLFAMLLILTIILAAIGKPIQALIAGTIAGTVDLILCYALIPGHQLLGAAIANSWGMLIGNVIASVLLRRYIDKIFEAGKIAKILLLGAITAIVNYIISPTGYWIILSYSFLTIAYMISLYFTKVIDKEIFGMLKLKASKLTN